MKPRCEICATATQRGRLCESCREALERVKRVWVNLSIAERGWMHYQVMQQRLEGTQTAPDDNRSNVADPAANAADALRPHAGARRASRG